MEWKKCELEWLYSITKDGNITYPCHNGVFFLVPRIVITAYTCHKFKHQTFKA